MQRHNGGNKVESYNWVLTTDWMYVSPRTQEDYENEGQRVAVNSTGMVGLLLAKSHEQAEFIEQVGPSNILAYVGSPWPSRQN